MTCIQCGAPLSADNPFCPKCGARQAAALPVAADPQRAALERALGAQYDIQRLLGRGGMGAVYLARERSLDRLVAIKILPPETAADAESRERFRREARTAAKLTHANIVPLYAFGDVEGMLYFVMGYVRGESLADRLRRDGKLAAEQARRILKEVADALEHAHRQGVVHRDIKPDNILLDDETGRPMLTDFGVAKARVGEGTLTAAGVVVGTPLYMSPEQASGAREIDGRSDLYSLGVLGYQMLSGRLPFEGEGFQDLIVQHISRQPPPLEALAPEAPRDLVAAVTKCLAKAPEQRWADARSLAAAVGTDGIDDEEPQDLWLRSIDRGLFRSIAAALASAAAAGILLVAPLGTWAEIRIWLVVAAPICGLGEAMEPLAAAFIARRRSRSWSEIRTLYLRPPSWWQLWWPAAWRRSSDLWFRLPLALRQIRNWRTMSLGLLVTFFAAIPAVLIAERLGASDTFQLLLLVLLGFPPLVAGLSAMVIGWRRLDAWRRLAGLSPLEAYNAVSRRTTDLAFWRKPKFAALLEPVGTRKPALAEPQSPQEFVAAIGGAVWLLAEPLRDVGREATEAAAQLAASIAALDAEIGQLARDASPAELAAIEQKLATLGAATDNDARRQMRGLFESQRDLLRKLAGQLDAASARRAHLADLLKALWLQTANLRAQVAADAAQGTEVSGRIRALCGEISAQAAAMETVRAIAPPG